MSGRSTAEWIGLRFGMLVILEECGRKNRSRVWSCKCDCGEITRATTGHLNAGSKVSCGCVAPGRKNRTHGLSGTPEYRAWENARSRCYNRKNRKYPLYGARGITMCDEWRTSFDQFIKDMGMRPSSEHSLDREDSNGPYCKENCRWATVVEQNNNRSSNKLLFVDGEGMTVAQASRRFGVPHATILGRLKAGKSAREAVNG